jgi:hypothetical protein
LAKGHPELRLQVNTSVPEQLAPAPASQPTGGVGGHVQSALGKLPVQTKPVPQGEVLATRQPLPSIEQLVRFELSRQTLPAEAQLLGWAGQRQLALGKLPWQVVLPAQGSRETVMHLLASNVQLIRRPSVPHD